ncbi:MAG: TonB C-terminal domain-containing protein [Acidobacteria bacterium]|jgi:hypothetical protein|nr:TonB C-terminal domain-containing protein [Acidobacteriota bacterium]
MKKLCFLLSILAHALAWVIIWNARFTVTIHREPARVVTVRIAEPPPPFIANGRPPQAASVHGSPPLAGGGNAGATAGMRGGASSATGTSGRARPFVGAGGFSLTSHAGGDFRLAPVGKSPDPWAVPLGPAPSSRLLGHRPQTFRPATGGDGANGGTLLLPFDIREKAVADWARSVLARIERNWIIPASGRLAFSGRVQITLTIERQGQRRALVIDDSTVPETLTLAALHAVQSSLPFPPLPENVAGTTLALTFVFSYNG